MPPLLCPSPVILDQSFPRDEYELRLVGEALGEIQNCIEKNRAHLILTDILRDLVESFDWVRTGPYPLLSIIFGLLNQWLLQPHVRLIEVDVSNVDDYQPHPLPQSTGKQGLAECWADEVGKLLTLHDSFCTGTQFFVGIACESAFAGEDLGEYDNPTGQRAFPLVGPDDLNQLLDAYDWQIPIDMYDRSVSFDSAFKNCGIIGATHVDPPASGSHYKVHFEGQRPWPLDKNTDPVPERYLRELTAITGYRLSVIKYALINGELPPKTLRFET